MGVRLEEGVQMKVPVLGVEFTMQERGTTLVEGPWRRTMETEVMPAVGWRGERSVLGGGIGINWGCTHIPCYCEWSVDWDDLV